MRSTFPTYLGMGITLFATLASAMARADGPEPPPPLEKPNALRGRIFISASAKPEGTLSGLVAVSPGELSWSAVRPRAGYARISPDGRSVAFMHRDKDAGVTVQVDSLKPSENPVVVFQGAGAPVGWLADGKQLIISQVPEPQVNEHTYQAWRVDADGSGQVQFEIPEKYQVFNSSPDGKWLVAQVHRVRSGVPAPNPARVNRPIVVIRPDGKEERTVASGEDAPATESGPDRAVVFSPRISPDGRSLVYIKRSHRGEGENALMVVSIDGKNRKRLLSAPGWRSVGLSACWSPDGKWLAVGRVEFGPKGEEAEGRLDVMAADGTNRRAIHLPAVAGVYVMDWR